jgi:PAS domain S-box-containing protein
LLAIIASATDAIVTIDARHRITLFNHAAEQMFRCPAAEAIGEPLDRFIPQRFRDVHREHIKAFEQARTTTRAMGHQRPLAALRADGTEFPIEATISQVAVRGETFFTAIVRDITERLHGQEALRESEARLRAIVETAVDAIVTIDEAGVIESVNPATERMFGYDARELSGRNVNVLMPEPYRSEHDGYLQSYLRTGRAKIIGVGREVLGLRKDGTVFPLDLSVSEFRIGDRQMFTGIMHDISNRRRLEREILDASANEQRRIGHELHDGLCQQLTGISFATEILARQLQDKAPDVLPRVRKLADEVDQTITHARTLARGLNPVEIHAESLASSLEDLSRKVSETFGVSCRFRSEGGCDGGVGDNLTASHLYRIAQEAISNAVRHGGAKKIEVKLQIEPGSLSLSVADDGRGFEIQGDAAGPREKPPGIGLQTMSYRAKMINGILDVRPRTPRGVIVTCSVPLGDRSLRG